MWILFACRKIIPLQKINRTRQFGSKLSIALVCVKISCTSAWCPGKSLIMFMVGFILVTVNRIDKMKNLKLSVLLSVFLFVFGACDKPYGDEGEENIELPDKNDGTEDDGGAEDGDISLGDVVDVSTFLNTPIYAQVWVKGYIVGSATGANGKTRYDFEPPFSYDTAILLADKEDADSETEVMSVCLTSCSKKIREKLNLADHPENKGKRLAVFGFQDVYLKIYGIKKIDAYEFPSK